MLSRGEKQNLKKKEKFNRNIPEKEKWKISDIKQKTLNKMTETSEILLVSN